MDYINAASLPLMNGHSFAKHSDSGLVTGSPETYDFYVLLSGLLPSADLDALLTRLTKAVPQALRLQGYAPAVMSVSFQVGDEAQGPCLSTRLTMCLDDTSM